MASITKKIISYSLLVLILLVTGCGESKNLTKTEPQVATFSWFEYQGDDEMFRSSMDEDQFRNPILSGYYPDPSVVVVGDDYYMVNSTFGLYPGIPVFHSTDLVNWTQLGNAIDRPDMLPYDDVLHAGYLGVFAATIEYHQGTFYIMNTCVYCGGNFVLTAKDPAGPWSDPIWLPHIDGIDPSLFIDDDGKFFVVHNKEPEDPTVDGHRVISVMEVDPATFAARSEDITLIDGADPAPYNTTHIEGPHIYKIEGQYYVSAAGGGTGLNHQQLIFRSENILGPYLPYENNPILTQVGLAKDRKNAVTSTGHTDIFKDANGDWWAVFLGTRVYGLDKHQEGPANFHTGRETFLLPVTWKDGWPIILESGKPVPLIVDRPSLPDSGPAPRPTTGNYTVKDEFNDSKLGFEWLFVRAPESPWWQTGDGNLKIQARANRIGSLSLFDYTPQPSFIGQRVAHMSASATTEMRFTPETEDEEAGMMALQNDFFYYAFGLGLSDNDETVLRVRMRNKMATLFNGETLAEIPVNVADGAPIYLRTTLNKDKISFAYSLDGNTFISVLENADATVLTTAKAGGFIGAVIGLYAEGEVE